jgi:predicted methyltransferase MtxX (methanogen marker protein 4)
MIKLFLIVMMVALLAGIAGLGYRHAAYDVVYLDTNNSCNYENGKLVSSTKAKSIVVEKLIKSSQVDSYLRQAETRHQCV